MSSCNNQINMIIGDVNFEGGVCYSISEDKTPSFQHFNIQLFGVRHKQRARNWLIKSYSPHLLVVPIRRFTADVIQFIV